MAPEFVLTGSTRKAYLSSTFSGFLAFSPPCRNTNLKNEGTYVRLFGLFDG